MEDGDTRSMALIELDARGRTSLGKVVTDKQQRLYQAEVSPDGTITLTPAVVMSTREAALFRNAAAMKRIKTGVEQGHAGKTHPVDWTVFGDLDADD